MNNEDDDWSYVDLYAVIEGRVPSRTLSPYRSHSSFDEKEKVARYLQRNNNNSQSREDHVGRNFATKNPHQSSTINDSQRRKDQHMSIDTTKNMKQSIEEITDIPSKTNPMMTKQKKSGRTISKSLTPTRTRDTNWKEPKENHVLHEGSMIIVPNTTSSTPVRTRSASLWNEKYKTEGGTNSKNSSIPKEVVLHSMHQERRCETERERNGINTQDKKSFQVSSSSVPIGISTRGNHNGNNSHPPSRCIISPKRTDRMNEKMNLPVDKDITKSLSLSSSLQESKLVSIIPLRRRSNSCHTRIGNKPNVHNTSKEEKKSSMVQNSQMNAANCARKFSSEHNHHPLRSQPKNGLHNSTPHIMMDNNNSHNNKNNSLVTNQRMTRSLSPIPVIEIPSSVLDRRRRIPTSQSPTRNTVLRLPNPKLT